MKMLAWGTVDQVVVAVGNLATTIVVARTLGASGLGIYAVGAALVAFALAAEISLVTQPHNVYRAADAQGAGLYTRSCTGFTMMLAAGTSLAAALVGSLLMPLPAAGCLGLWVGAAVLAEFGRRILYSTYHARRASIVSAVNNGGQALALLLLWQTGTTSLTAIFAAAAATSFVAYLTAVASQPEIANPANAREALRENWPAGRYVLGASMLGYAANQGVVLCVTAAGGVVTAGVVRGAELLWRPLGIPLAVADLLLPIRARDQRDRALDMRYHVKRDTAFAAAAAAGYGAVAILVGPFAIENLLNIESPSLGTLAGLAVYYIMISVAKPSTAALRADGHTRPLAASQAVAAALVAICAPYLILQPQPTVMVAVLAIAAAGSAAVTVRALFSYPQAA